MHQKPWVDEILLVVTDSENNLFWCTKTPPESWDKHKSQLSHWKEVVKNNCSSETARILRYYKKTLKTKLLSDEGTNNTLRKQKSGLSQWYTSEISYNKLDSPWRNSESDLMRLFSIYPKNHWTLQGLWMCLSQGSPDISSPHQWLEIPWFLGSARPSRNPTSSAMDFFGGPRRIKRNPWFRWLLK